MQLKPFLMPVAVAAFVLPSILGNTSKALAEDIRFTLENRTSANMTAFYASPAGVENWENDILGEDVLSAGDSVDININDERTTCIYDFRATFADGDVVEKYKVNICKLAGSSYEFYDK